MNEPKHTNDRPQAPAQSHVESPSKPTIQTAASASLSAPVAREAQQPAKDLLKEFAPSGSQPTPGDWRYEPGFDAVVVVVGNELKAVADFGKSDLPEVVANGRLMGASKELLEALKDARQALAHIIHVTRDLPIRFSSSIAIKGAEEKARLAITKAERG